MKGIVRFVIRAILSIITGGIFFASPAVAGELTVSAALSLKNALAEIGPLFEKRHPGMTVRFNYGASGDLMAQIRAGAPVDVFVPAAVKDMEQLDAAGRVVPGSTVIVAANRLVIVVPLTPNMRIDSAADLAKTAVRRIAIGNPRTVPAGRYAEESISAAGVAEAVKGKLVLTENVRQALDYAARGEVDAAVVFATDAGAKPKDVRVAAIVPESQHKPIRYLAAVVRGSADEPAARAFTAFLQSAEAQEALARRGFERVR